MFSVPADAARRVAVAAGVLGAERAFNAPVVRQVHAAPRRVSERRHRRRRKIALAETPVAVEVRHGSRRRQKANHLDRIGGGVFLRLSTETSRRQKHRPGQEQCTKPRKPTRGIADRFHARQHTGKNVDAKLFGGVHKLGSRRREEADWTREVHCESERNRLGTILIVGCELPPAKLHRDRVPGPVPFANFRGCRERGNSLY